MIWNFIDIILSPAAWKRAQSIAEPDSGSTALAIDESWLLANRKELRPEGRLIYSMSVQSCEPDERGGQGDDG
jgi:hypothetical protein